MRILVSFILIFSIGILRAQNTIVNDETTPVNPVDLIMENSVYIENHGKFSNINGSPYLFDSWNNNTKLFIDNSVCELKSLNFNVQSQRFEANLSEDSVLVINTAKVRKIMIGDKVFSRFNLKDNTSNPFFEIIGEFDNLILLKKYKLTIKESSFNPLTQQRYSPSVYTIKEVFFTSHLDGTNVEVTKLKMKSILKLFNESKQEKIKEFASQNNLSFKDENDVHRIIDYTHTL